MFPYRFYDGYRSDTSCNRIRWIQFILCLVCLIIVICIFALLAPLALVIMAIFIMTVAAFVIITYSDVLAQCCRRPIHWSPWLVIAISGAVLFFLCSGLAIAVILAGFTVTMLCAILFMCITGILFLIDVIYTGYQILARGKTAVGPIEDGPTSVSATEAHEIPEMQDEECQFPSNYILKKTKPCTCHGKVNSVTSYGGTFHMSKDTAPLPSPDNINDEPSSRNVVMSTRVVSKRRSVEDGRDGASLPGSLDPRSPSLIIAAERPMDSSSFNAFRKENDSPPPSLRNVSLSTKVVPRRALTDQASQKSTEEAGTTTCVPECIGAEKPMIRTTSKKSVVSLKDECDPACPGAEKPTDETLCQRMKCGALSQPSSSERDSSPSGPNIGSLPFVKTPQVEEEIEVPTIDYHHYQGPCPCGMFHYTTQSVVRGSTPMTMQFSQQTYQQPSQQTYQQTIRQTYQQPSQQAYQQTDLSPRRLNGLDDESPVTPRNKSSGLDRISEEVMSKSSREGESKERKSYDLYRPSTRSSTSSPQRRETCGNPPHSPCKRREDKRRAMSAYDQKEIPTMKYHHYQRPCYCGKTHYVTQTVTSGHISPRLAKTSSYRKHDGMDDTDRKGSRHQKHSRTFSSSSRRSNQTSSSTPRGESSSGMGPKGRSLLPGSTDESSASASPRNNCRNETCPNLPCERSLPAEASASISQTNKCIKAKPSIVGSKVSRTTSDKGPPRTVQSALSQQQQRSYSGNE